MACKKLTIKGYFFIISCLILATVFLNGFADKDVRHTEASANIGTGILRKEVFALVSSAENSSIDYSRQYAYIEDIGDGRGYTAGIIGFTSGTGDLLQVVTEYIKRKPQNNPLKKYLSALEAVVGTDSHEGLGDTFLADWQTASEDAEMIQAQNAILDDFYLYPSITFANEDGLSVLGQYIYYDAMVVHGPGDDEDSFNGIRMTAKASADTPAMGGNEKTYLQAFLDARSVIMKKEEAHSDLSRLNTQQAFLEAGNETLELPLRWTMYGEAFELDKSSLSSINE
ncbi:MAG: chitosanase [Lachnospiraceae bacterium]|nr:chitosanase [Lachnospiraceae bacterium]